MSREKIIEKKTMITLNKSTVEKLKGCGKKGETYDEVVNRLIERCKK